MRMGWQEPGLNDDIGMNIGPDRVDLAELQEAEQRFLRATEAHVTALITPWWQRALNCLRPSRGPTAS
ncbi:hypothetical protein ACQPZA_18790 [Pseudonocardia xinjiangensis]|uniref:hypothetical protein n=1 Tax=Pseudonocardia xinjiangensis TaxID=75289 RepID=UPI003D923F21